MGLMSMNTKFRPLFILVILFVSGFLFFGVDVDHVEAAASKCDTVTFTTGGTIDTAEDAPSGNFYHGAWFRGTCNAVNGNGSATISGITVTVNDATGLSNMDIYTDQVSNCTTASPTGATLFGTTASVGATTAVSGTATIGVSAFRCFYVILDIGTGAVDQQTLDISINASTNITNDVTTAGTFPLNPIGVTTISNPVVLSVPTVDTDAVTNVGVSSATLNATITNDGGDTPTTLGFAFSTDSTLTTGVSTTTGATVSMIVDFFQNVSGLLSGVQYFVRGYAINSEGTGIANNTGGGCTNGICSFTTSTDSTPSRKIRLFEGGRLKLLNGGRMIVY